MIPQSLDNQHQQIQTEPSTNSTSAGDGVVITRKKVPLTEPTNDKAMSSTTEGEDAATIYSSATMASVETKVIDHASEIPTSKV